jgi:hypothetical protein
VSQQQNPIERAVDLFVFAPIGVAMFAKDTVPTFMKMFVSRGQTELQHRKKALHDQANQYRSVGKFAVKYGGPEVKRSASGKLDGARRMAEETFTGLIVPRLPGAGSGAEPVMRSAPPAPEPAATPKPKPKKKPAKVITKPAGTAKANGSGTNGKAKAPSVPAPPESALPIHEYDQLSASQVVERLDGLTAAELDTVREYELAHRGRSTILGKIMQLTS